MEPESSEASPLPTDQESSKPPIEEQEKGDNIYVDYLQRILDKIKKSVVKSATFCDMCTCSLKCSPSWSNLEIYLQRPFMKMFRKSAEELMKQLQPQLKENLQVRDALYTLSVVRVSGGILHCLLLSVCEVSSGILHCSCSDSV